MTRLTTMLALAALAATAPCHGHNERTEIEAVYKRMSRAFAAKDAKGYTAFWAPAIRWFPPHKYSTSELTKGRSELIRDLRSEFSHPDRLSQDYGFTRIETDPERATIDLAVSTAHAGPVTMSRTSSERHHWLKAGGRWWLSRIEALG